LAVVWPILEAVHIEAKMVKPTSIPAELNPSDRDEMVSYAREHLMAAAVVLKTLGPSLARVGWMVEDTLVYLETALAPGEEDQGYNDVQPPSEEATVDVVKPLEAANAR
jgi:hypothetical protein